MQFDIDRLVWIASVILLLGLSFFFSKKARKRSKEIRLSSLDLLKKQFDKGEISKEVFEAKRKKLK